MKRGFTLLEVLVVLSVVCIVVVCTANLFLNNMRVTELRADEIAREYVERNGMSVKRLSCAGDSDNDGYSTCNIVLEDGEKIILKCPCDFMNVNMFGARGCKEVLNKLDINAEM